MADEITDPSQAMTALAGAADELDARGRHLTGIAAEACQSTRATRRLLKTVRARVLEIERLETTAKQLRGELANELATRAAEISDEMSYEDCASLLRALAGVIR